MRPSFGVRGVAALVCVVGLSGLLAACGDDDEAGTDGAAQQGEETTSTGEAPSGEPIRLGVISAESGPAASFNPSQVRGVEFWANELNADGGIDGRPVELVKCDDESTPEGGAACGRELEGDVSMVLALGQTASVKAVHQTLPNALVLNTSPNVLPEDTTTFFQVSEPVGNAIKAVFEFAKEHGFDSLGVLAATDASGEAAVNGVSEASKDFPGIEVVSQRIEPQDIEASGQLANLESDGVDMLYASYSGAGAATVVQAYKNLGLDIPFVISSANTSREFMDLVKPYLPDPFYGIPSPGAAVPEALDDPERAEEIFLAFEEQFDHRPDPLEVTGIYVGDVAEAVLRELGDDFEPAEAAEALKAMTVESLTDVRFDHFPGLNVGFGYQPHVYEWFGDRWGLPEE